MSEVKKIKPSLSKGTRDFLPAEVAKRNYIFDTIKAVFRKYGFEQIETPAIERLETLTGKYGEEGDKLLFKILNSGDYLNAVPVEELSKGNSQSIAKYISEKGLRYDLTVPLARYVVQHQDDLAFPFKRFHIGPVWRADRPQKGRYQEFYQCDADVIGSNSLLNEVELTKIYLEVFQHLRMKVNIQINNRKILKAIASLYKIEDKANDFFAAVDVYDKSGVPGVMKELERRGVVIHTDYLNQKDFQSAFAFLRTVWSQSASWEDVVEQFKHYLFLDGGVSQTASDGVNELYVVCKQFGIRDGLVFNPYLARGLDYYTGSIWEVVLDKNEEANKSITIGSLGGGGRYDNLTEMFGGQNMSGVGISFGIERIYDVMEELNLFPETISQGVKVLFVPRDASAEEFTFQQTQTLRDAGIPAEIFLGNVKKQKQFNYAEQKNIAYLVEVGGDEISSQKFRLRNAKTRDTQNDLSILDIIEILNKG